MSGTRGGLGRIVAMGIGLAVALLLLLAGEARAGFYSVAQCGWGAGADADWWDSTDGAKFRPDGFCSGGEGDHLKSFTRDGASTVTGTRFARWRWVAPPTTAIRQVRGNWWHTLHDGMEQRIGAADLGGGFDPFLAANGTDTTQRGFTQVFTPSVPAIEDRLLCARGEDKWCSLDPGSWSGLRGLTLTVDDGVAPGAWITGGDLTDGGWRRGGQFVAFAGSDAGSGVRYGETSLDGARVGLAEYPCAAASIEGEWRATRMRPCLTDVSGTQSIDTTRFSDGNHTLRHCATDFAGNASCAAERTVGIDNNPPTNPRNLALAGGEGWRRVDDFDLSWANPDQGPASPIWGAYWRIAGPAGYDSGVQFAAGLDVAAIADLNVPAPGAYTLQLWLRDEAGNSSVANAVEVPLRFDDVPPSAAFETDTGPAIPEQIRAEVGDGLSGVAGATIFYRRLEEERWSDLPTTLQRSSGSEPSRLLARLPALSPGTYVFRADVADAAGNSTSTTRRADGTQMALRKVAEGSVAPARARGEAPAGQRAKTRLFARLQRGRERGPELTVPFGAAATLGGRLLRADGSALADRELRVLSRPSKGATGEPETATVGTGSRGGFRLELGPGPSRRVSVGFAGDPELEGARRTSLLLRVRAGVSLAAAPRALRTGRALRLSGRVRSAGAAIPRRGKLVAIQYFEQATRSWRPVLVTRTDHGGRFRAHYRFRYVTGTASIRLRAVALAEERWPYAPGASPPTIVRVSG